MNGMVGNTGLLRKPIHRKQASTLIIPLDRLVEVGFETGGVFRHSTASLSSYVSNHSS